MHEPAYNPSVVPVYPAPPRSPPAISRLPDPVGTPMTACGLGPPSPTGQARCWPWWARHFFWSGPPGPGGLDQIFRLPGLWAVYDRPLHRLYSVPLRQHHSPGPAGPAEI